MLPPTGWFVVRSTGVCARSRGDLPASARQPPSRRSRSSHCRAATQAASLLLQLTHCELALQIWPVAQSPLLRQLPATQVPL